MQLQLTKEELERIGFKRSRIEGDEMNPPVIVWDIPTRNGFFRYNEDQPEYKWYHVTKTGDGYNFVHLDISKKPELMMVLLIFRVKYKSSVI